MKKDWFAGSLGGLALALYALPGWTNDAQTPAIAVKSIAPSSSSELEAQNSALGVAPVPQIRLEVAPPEAIAIDRQDLTEHSAEDSMAQVTSVSQLLDVKPSDWAFQALQSLVERYGVAVGYPDRTFRGNRPLSRYEFSAALNAVLGKIDERLLAGELGREVQEDVLTVRRLLSAYGTATEDLQKRVDTLTSRNRVLEAQQFSTTTKLSGQTIFAPTNGTDAETSFVSRTRLTLTTSFDGSDRLVTQLQAGNHGGDAISNAHNQRQNLLGTTGLLAGGGGLDYVGVDPQVRLRKLYYVFQPIPSLEIAVGSNLPPSDFVDRNSFANDSAENFASSFFANNPLIVQNELDRGGGAGAAVSWNIQENLTLRALYAAADAATATRGGLFGDRYQGTLEVEYALPRQPVIVRLQYTHAEINGSTINAGGINAEWAVTRQFGVFGRLGIAGYQGFNSAIGRDLDLNPKSWAFGVTVRNFLISGSKAGLAIGQPFVETKLGNATQTNFEAYFGLLLNDHINFSPSFMIVSNPNDRASPTIFEWAIRFVIEY